MAKYLQFQLNEGKIGGKPFLSLNLLREMRTVQNELEGQKSGYGLGVLIRPFYNHTQVFHPGDGYGYQSLHTWIPEAKIGIAILTNDGNASPFTSEISGYVLKMIYNLKNGWKKSVETIKSDEPVIDLPQDYLQKFVASYQGNQKLVSMIVSDKTLAIVTGSDTTKLKAHSKNKFFAVNGDKFFFYPDQKGKPAHFINLNQYTADFYIYNDSPNDKPGPAKSAWKSWVGTYKGYNNRQPQTIQIYLKNGYLYCSRKGATRLTEFKPGLFFTSDGDPVIKKGKTVYVGNRAFTKP